MARLRTATAAAEGTSGATMLTIGGAGSLPMIFPNRDF
jgi:hypothetical protein